MSYFWELSCIILKAPILIITLFELLLSLSLSHSRVKQVVRNHFLNIYPPRDGFIPLFPELSWSDVSKTTNLTDNVYCSCHHCVKCHLCVSQFPLPPGDILFSHNPLSGSQTETLHSSGWFYKHCSGNIKWCLRTELLRDQLSDAKHLILVKYVRQLETKVIQPHVQQVLNSIHCWISIDLRRCHVPSL